MTEENLLKAIDIFCENNQLFRIPVIALKLTTDKNKLYAIDKIKHRISSTAAWDLADSMEEDESRFKVIDMLKDRIELPYFKFYYSMKEVDSKLKILRTYKNKINIDIEDADELFRDNWMSQGKSDDSDKW